MSYTVDDIELESTESSININAADNGNKQLPVHEVTSSVLSVPQTTGIQRIINSDT